MSEEKLVGRITHYFGKVEVGVIELSDVLKIGDTILLQALFHALSMTASPFVVSIVRQKSLSLYLRTLCEQYAYLY